MNVLTTLKEKGSSLKSKATLALIGASTALAAAVPAHAEGDIDDLFAAVNVSGISTNTKTLFLAGAGILTLFIGYKYLKKGGNRM